MFIIFCGTFMLNHCPLLVLCSTSPKNGSFTGTTTYGSSSTELSYNSSWKPIPWSWLLHISLSLILLFITHSWQVFLNSCLRVRWTIMLLEYNWFSLLCLLLAFGRPRKKEDKKGDLCSVLLWPFVLILAFIIAWLVISLTWCLVLSFTVTVSRVYMLMSICSNLQWKLVCTIAKCTIIHIMSIWNATACTLLALRAQSTGKKDPSRNIGCRSEELKTV